MKKTYLREKGITLVALVITIIILLILAGVTLTTALGQNGLFKRAKYAGEEYEKAGTEEEDRVNNLEIQIQDIENLMKQGQKKREKKNVSELQNGEIIIYKTNDGKEIPCFVLYDEKYNEEKKTNYGVQVMALNPVCEISLGINDPNIPSDVASQNVYDKGVWSYNNVVNNLNNKAETYRNPQYTNEGGARWLGTVPSNPSAANGDKTDFNRIQELINGGVIQFNEDFQAWYAFKEYWTSYSGYQQHNGVNILSFSGSTISLARIELAVRSHAYPSDPWTLHDVQPKPYGFMPIFKLDNITQVELMGD